MNKIEIHNYNAPKGYPNAKRVSQMLWECQGCKSKKMDIDLYQDTGLCGDCQFKQWEIERNENNKENKK